MSFADKLNLLIQIFSITNNQLARAIKVDPSLISRWRNGSRTAGSNSDYITALAEYFARSARMDYQRRALWELTGEKPPELSGSPEQISKVLLSWLSAADIKASGDYQIKNFMNSLVQLGAAKEPSIITDNQNIQFHLPTGKDADSDIYFGIQGKREAVIRFLSMVLAAKPCELFLMSEEDMEWLTGDREFYGHWASLLMKVVTAGSRIKIIHTVNRDTSELMKVIDKWLPIHMTGRIESYYYPKYRESLFKRTMFIAVGLAAITSTSIGDKTDSTLNFFFLDKKVLSSITEDFNTYLSECRQLMMLYTKERLSEYSQLLLELEAQSGDCITYKNTLSSLTMPDSILKKFLSYTDMCSDEKEKMLSLHRARVDAFEAYLKYNQYTEIINISSECLNGRQNMNLSSIESFINRKIEYTNVCLADHIENIVNFLKTYDNFNLIMANNLIPENRHNVFLSVKCGIGVIASKYLANDENPIIIAMNESNMTDAFANYLYDMADNIPKKQRDKNYIISILCQYRDKLTGGP